MQLQRAAHTFKGSVSYFGSMPSYEAASGRMLDLARVRYWEVMAALRWLVIALEQRDRFLRGGERSLQLLLNGRRPAECELEILRLTEAA